MLTKEFAPGLPHKVAPPPPPVIKKPISTTYSVQEHLARRAGKHTDLRVAIRGKAHSWAVPHFPRKVGDKALALHQPLHTTDYMGWSGKIDSGYGAGNVRLKQHGKITLLESGPNKVKFVTQQGSKPKAYVLVRTAKDWLLMQYRPKKADTY